MQHEMLEDQVLSLISSIPALDVFVFLDVFFVEEAHLPSLKLTFSPLKMDGWNTLVSFWDGLFSGANC